MRKVTETTCAATADSGMRTFSIVTASGESEVQVCAVALQNSRPPDEPIERLEVHEHVPTNRDLAQSLFALASVLMELPGSTLPPLQPDPKG